MAKPKRARSERRAQDRGLRKEIGARQKLVTAAPGGAADRPITVSSAAVIEGQARSLGCGLCGGTLELRQHRAAPGDLRVVELVCRLCHTPRQAWFRIVAPLAN